MTIALTDLRNIPRISQGKEWTAQQRTDILAIWQDIQRAINALNRIDPNFLPIDLASQVSGILPVANGGTNAATAAAARANLSAAQIQAPGAHTIVLAKITGGGANGSLTWNSEGVITGFVDPT